MSAPDNQKSPLEIRRCGSTSPFEATFGFCRALAIGDRLLVAGTAPIGPSGETVGVGDAHAQARRCLAIVEAALASLGGRMDQVVRTRMFITDRAVWAEVARAHGEVFADARPVATCVVVSGLIDPDWLVEIEAEAWCPESARTGAAPVGDALVVRPLGEADLEWARSQQQRLFHGEVVVSRGVARAPLERPGFVALRGGERLGLATYRLDGDACELYTLDALVPWEGIGTALLAATEDAARAAGCQRLWLITTNDNLDALRFYQRRGYHLAAVHPDAIAGSRRLKPSIPEIGSYGIPIRDELVLERSLLPT